jgi:hypothetical protein
MKIIYILILISSLFCIDTLTLLNNVIAGQKEVQKEYKKSNFEFPTSQELKQIAKEIDKSGFNNYDIVSLFCSESCFNKKEISAKNAYGICQLMLETKRYLLKKNKEVNQSSPIQDARLALFLIKENNDTISNINKRYPTFDETVLIYNAGLTAYFKNGWNTNREKIYIQPKLLIRSCHYYRDNFKAGVYDIDIDAPGYRYTLKTNINEVAFRVNPKFKNVYVNIKKLTLIDGKNVYKIGAGAYSNGICQTPKGQFRVIWSIKYCMNEGGVFGVAFLRLNHKDEYDRSLGIHGTNDDRVIGTYHTWGCIRLYNKDMLKLYDSVSIGDYIYIN